MGKAAFAVGLSHLWFTELLYSTDDTESDFLFDVSQRLASRVEDYESAIDAFAREDAP